MRVCFVCVCVCVCVCVLSYIWSLKVILAFCIHHTAAPHIFAYVVQYEYSHFCANVGSMYACACNFSNKYGSKTASSDENSSDDEGFLHVDDRFVCVYVCVCVCVCTCVCVCVCVCI